MLNANIFQAKEVKGVGSMKVKIGLIQMTVLEDKLTNMKNAIEKIKCLAEEGADLIVLPEMFNCPYNNQYFSRYAEKEGGEAWKGLSNAAKNNRVILVGGTMPEVDDKNRIYNTCYTFDRNGKQIGKHRKMHLFDIDIEGGQKFKESETLSQGDSVTVFETEYCKIGTAICYDFRFPELARLMVMNGAKIIIVPAAFNMTTGPAHWEMMFRQRAVDNQIFTIGVAPARNLESSYVSYANSIVASPWGDIVIRMGELEETQIVEIDLDMVDKIREELPLMKHRRTDVYKLELL
jgi:omega-amidase